MPPSTTEDLPFPRAVDTYKFPDPTTQEEKTAFRTKGASKYYDPCATASQASMRCLDRNNYDRSKCQEAFDAYKECKRMWVCAVTCIAES
jgi:cytochrome c oxidase assembly protein subunit 23